MPLFGQKSYFGDAELPTSTEVSDQRWEVDEILSSKYCEDGKIYYLVRWKDFTEQDNAWVREEDMVDCQDLLLQFRLQD